MISVVKVWVKRPFRRCMRSTVVIGVWESNVQSFGVVAQLVEHLLCKQGVVSSSLISSTKTRIKGG